MKLVALSALSLGVAFAACATDASKVDPNTLRTAPPGACGSVETHVVGIYKSNGEIVDVVVDRPGKHNLVLSAHDATKWRVTARNGAIVERVYAVGYHTQAVAVPYGTRVLKDSHDDTGVYACGYTNGSANGCDTDALMTLASTTLHHVSSFHACRQGTTWKIGDDLATSSNCADALDSVQVDSLAGCAAYMNGEATCGDGGGSGGATEPGGSGGTGSGSGQPSSGGDQTGDPGPIFL